AALEGYEDRPQQRQLAAAIERTFAEGGALVAEAGTGVGKSIAYLVPAIASAVSGERVIVSTHTLPLQDQLVRKDIPAVQAALGTELKVAVLKGRANYLCPRRWQIFRGAVATREEARLLSKTLVWRSATETGDRAELNLMSGESELWSRISANDESCDQRRCKRTPGGCYLQRAREAAAEAAIVVVNHALLLQDARMRGALLPQAENLVVDEAHRLEDVATDAFGLELSEPRLRRDLARASHSLAVTAALRDPARAQGAERIRAEVQRALGLHVAQTHLGGVLRRRLVDAHRSVVLTSATLAVAGSFEFAVDRFGIRDIADTISVGSPFDHRRQALLVLPDDIALPGEERFAEDAARTIDGVARALGGRTLVLFTAHRTLRDVAARLGALEQEGLAVLVQGVDGSRRALLERFAQGRAVLLGTQSFWEGVDLPG